MIIPKHLLWDGMTDDVKKQQEAFVKNARKVMRKAPTFSGKDEAVKGAVKMAREDEYSSPSVWREPEDVGRKFAVVHADYREDAYNSGYAEAVDEQAIFDAANGITRGKYDKIKEV